jgi:hypothetical protein
MNEMAPIVAAARSPDAPSPSPPGHRRSAASRLGGLGVSTALVVLVVWLVSASAVRTSEGVSVGGPFSGGAMHVGQLGMVEQELVVLWARPRVIGSGEVQVRVCRRDASPGGGAIGSISGDEDLRRLCRTLEPLRRGTRLFAEAPDGGSLDYVVVSLSPAAPDDTVFYCGLDLVYRSGARLGIARKAGTNHAVVFPEGRDPFVDGAGELSALPDAGQDDPC